MATPEQPPATEEPVVFTADDAAALRGPEWLRRERVAAMERVASRGLPSAEDEIWRYSRIDELDLDRYPLAGADAADAATVTADGGDVAAILAAIGERTLLVVTTDGGRIEVVDGEGGAAPGVYAGPARSAGALGVVSDTASPFDAFAELNRGLAPEPVEVTIEPGTVVEHPIVVVHRVRSAAATFPRTVVRVGERGAGRVLECFVSEDIDAFVAPVTELVVGDEASLDHVALQMLGPSVWQTAYSASRVGRDATLRSFAVALGGGYARVRTDSLLAGAGGTSELAALYFGSGDQMHDFRTLQDHAGAKSTSDLTFKGAVSGTARSAYSGLIRVRNGAAGTRAFQTNRNLVLSDTGLATYSVPNLDIEENDVACSHASTTGPIDADQRFYLESRGVPSEAAERLIVLGFFEDLLERIPVPGCRTPVMARIAEKLVAAEGIGA